MLILILVVFFFVGQCPCITNIFFEPDPPIHQGQLAENEENPESTINFDDHILICLDDRVDIVTTMMMTKLPWNMAKAKNSHHTCKHLVIFVIAQLLIILMWN